MESEPSNVVVNGGGRCGGFGERLKEAFTCERKL
jgi:hypothetical protein